MDKDKKITPAEQKITDKENAQANTHSEVREGQGNTSILSDDTHATDNSYPEMKQEDRQYKGQDEFTNKKSSKIADDE